MFSVPGKRRIISLPVFLAVVSVFLFASCPGTESPGEEELLLPPSKPQPPLLVSWNDMIIAGWEEVSGADSYEVYCNGDSENPGPAAKTAGAAGAVLTATGDQQAFNSGAAYYVWIRAKQRRFKPPKRSFRPNF
ncbi:MAG: hypothetical protein LBG10_05375 [Treponema sp.]|jgi:hypothetical protein|nr:hypothetical protein [Treponema sp.]